MKHIANLLSVLLVSTVLTLPGAAQGVGSAKRIGDRHLRAEWRMNRVGQGIWDSTPYRNHGFLGSSTGPDDNDPVRLIGEGPFGSNALGFDGEDDYVTIPRSRWLEPRHVTLELWVRLLGGEPGFRYLAIKGNHDCLCGSYALYRGGNNGIYFYVCDGTFYTVSPNGGSSVWDGEWHHVAGTYDGTAVRIYVDGEQVGTGALTSLEIGYGLNISNDLYIGANPVNTCPNVPTGFDGDLDEVRVWSRALSPEEVASRAQGIEL